MQCPRSLGRISPAHLALALALAGTGCAPSGTDGIQTGRFALGSTATMIDRLRTDHTRISGRYTFPTPSAAPIEAIVRDFDEGPGWFSMGGRASDSESSQFILKGGAESVYGWVVYNDRNIAYEYTTGPDGNVAVEQVPVTKIFAVCNAPDANQFGPPTVENADDIVVAAGAFPGHVGTYPMNDVTKLQSRPGVPKVWYIDLTDVMSGDTPKSGQTKADVWQTWAITAATLYQFKVNVTTDAAIYTAAGVANSGCSRMIYSGMGSSSSCGLNIFGTRTCCSNHIYANGYATGRIVNHEAGHGWGLQHDGGSDGGEYFNGFSEFQWTTLMGNIWPGDRWAQALFQYSKGEYTSATQKQDDFAIINKTLEYIEDDIATTTPLIMQGTAVPAAMNWGQIGRNTDTDSWSFQVAAGGGHATLKIDRIEDRGGGMLDVDASIVDATGKMIAQNNAAVARYANLSVDLPAGEYTLVIKGGAEGTPARGFSSYSSVGLYSIDGTITGGVPTTGGGGAGGGVGTGGATGTGGMPGMGGMTGAGGRTATGGTTGVGGRAGTGGATGTGGAVGTGGATGTGGTVGAGGATGTGGTGVVATGGSVGSGGAAVAGTGGQLGTGGTTSADGGTPPGAAVAGGCACRAGGDPVVSWSATSLAGLGLVSLLRRRRRASTVKTVANVAPMGGEPKAAPQQR